MIETSGVDGDETKFQRDILTAEISRKLTIGNDVQHLEKEEEDRPDDYGRYHDRHDGYGMLPRHNFGRTITK